MTRKEMLAVKAGAWLVAAALPLSVLGCQDQGRSDSMPNTNGIPTDKVTQPSAAKLDDATRTTILLRQLHAANQDEIDLGKIADGKAQNADVKRFANDMVTDHTAADQKLTDLAKRMNIDIATPPAHPLEKAISSASDECKRSLRNQYGAQFDVAYFAPQVDKHNFALKLIDEAQTTASGDVKKLLDEMRPTVEAHLDHAKGLMRGLSFSTAVGGGPASRESDPTGNTPGAGAKHDGAYHQSVPRDMPNGTPTNP